jgi:hypothetical protein
MIEELLANVTEIRTEMEESSAVRAGIHCAPTKSIGGTSTPFIYITKKKEKEGQKPEKGKD